MKQKNYYFYNVKISIAEVSESALPNAVFLKNRLKQIFPLGNKDIIKSQVGHFN